MIIKSQELAEQGKTSKSVGQEILDSLANYESHFAKATLTLCLATLVKENSSGAEKLRDLNHFTRLLRSVAQIPSVH